MKFFEIFENVFQFKDTINVYAIKNGTKAILIDFGSGDILNYLRDIGIDNVEYIFHTHYHRDQCYGDDLAIEQNIKIAAPEKERKLFSEAEKFWNTKSYYDIYYFKPTFFVSTKNIPLDLTFKEGDLFNWGDYQVKILETAGHTTGSISYLIEIDRKKLAFTGDLIHSGGKVITYYDLEYYYNDNGEGGIKRSLESFSKLLNENPQYLLSSHGEVISEPTKEIQVLEKKFKKARKAFYSEHSSIEILGEKGFKSVGGFKDYIDQFPHIIHDGFRPPYIILGDHQNGILIDYAGSDFFGYTPTALEEILNKHHIKKIDFVIPTHYHDDHTAGIPFLQSKYGAKVYALENIVDVLEHPTHYRIGCLTGQSIKVDRVLKDGECFEWEDYKFTVYHFPGQTEYHMGLHTKIDGKTVFFTGDTIQADHFFDRKTNLNCLNFCRIGKDVGYMKCADILLSCQPQYLAIAHYGIIKADKTLLKSFKKFVSDYEIVLCDIIAQEDPNIGFDPNWICFNPVRVLTKPGKKFKSNLIIRNYLNKKLKLEIQLNLPENWKTDWKFKSCNANPKEFLEIPVSIKVPQDEDPNGRTIVTANIICNENDLGPFPDLMVDHGFEPRDFWKGWRPENKRDLVMWIFKHINKDMRLFK
ncbi:MAG: MBL fold metallo-hydrolase [Candidatus Lokiarchaeota archaeon]|nr:MBL fold metallo-hydrolase [Candidatus Lokiarchaeota archaeon]